MIYNVFGGTQVSDYSLLGVLMKLSNPSHCALSPHIISPYNRLKILFLSNVFFKNKIK